MKIAYVEAAGFRGVRHRLRVDLPSGFAVITGRNGSGKSTICDAIEYALTGALSKYEDGKERGESVEDYLWWRGTGSAREHYVKVGIQTDDGATHEVERRPGGEEPNAPDLAAMLCEVGGMPADALGQLCRTAIVRDETIAALSVDLAETERFAFVRAALGTDALESINSRGRSVLSALHRRVQDADGEYARARQEVTALVGQLSAARTAVAGENEVAVAEERLRVILEAETGDAANLLLSARQQVVTLRRRSEILAAIRREASAAREERAVVQNPDANEANAARSRQRDALRMALATARDQGSQLQEAVALDERITSARMSLAALHEHALAVGLQHGRCPVCASPQTDAEFADALANLERDLRSEESAAAERARRLAESQHEQRKLERELTDLETEMRESDRRIRSVHELVEQVRNRSEEAGVPLTDALELALLDTEFQRVSEELRQLEDNVAVLESSADVERIAELGLRIEQAQGRSNALERRLKEAQAAEQEARSRLAGIRRAVGELVEERLASLDPIQNDLYSRLRPHVDWGEISYHLRGDVRRFLSLRVGEDVNPRFTFSSGQRRAIGLAFLLAVHLSRPWCKLRTLILDDPVQHIDDFRALHLVEVLGAVRKSGQQVVCAVEDRALADVMCRRLRTGVAGEGVLIEMAYQAGEGTTVVKAEPVRSAVRSLLLTA